MSSPATGQGKQFMIRASPMDHRSTRAGHDEHHSTTAAAPQYRRPWHRRSESIPRTKEPQRNSGAPGGYPRRADRHFGAAARISAALSTRSFRCSWSEANGCSHRSSISWVRSSASNKSQKARAAFKLRHVIALDKSPLYVELGLSRTDEFAFHCLADIGACVPWEDMGIRARGPRFRIPTSGGQAICCRNGQSAFRKRLRRL